jgi:Cysteine rich repeat
VKAHFSDLSEDCQVAIIRVAAVGKACKADVKQFCADVKPGKGAIADCMNSHVADISDGCKEALAKAEAGNK